MKSVVVTGVSTGIGWATSKALASHGFHVFGSVRKSADADRLKAELGASFTPLIFDVTDETAVHRAADEVRAALRGETLAGLVNNAGMAVPGPALELAPSDFRRQLDVNFIGMITTTQAFAPLLGTDLNLKGRAGRIVMMSSIAGKRGDPFMSAYVASKHAIEGFSESLRRELMLYGIDVIVIGPGPVRTPIWTKAEKADMAANTASPYHAALLRARELTAEMEEIALPPEKIGALVAKVLTIRRPKVRYAIVPDRLEAIGAAILPKRIVDRITAYLLGMKRLPRAS